MIQPLFPNLMPCHDTSPSSLTTLRNNFPNNSLKLITPIIRTSTTVNYFPAPQPFLQDLNIQSSLLETPSPLLSTFSWLLAIPCIQLRHHLLLGLNFSSTMTRCLFIKPASIYQKPTNGDINKYVALGKLFNLSKPKFPNQEEVTITTFKSENYMRPSSFQTLYITASNSNLVSFSPITSSHHGGILPTGFWSPWLHTVYIFLSLH